MAYTSRASATPQLHRAGLQLHAAAGVRTWRVAPSGWWAGAGRALGGRCRQGAVGTGAGGRGRGGRVLGGSRARPARRARTHNEHEERERALFPSKERDSVSEHPLYIYASCKDTHPMSLVYRTK